MKTKEELAKEFANSLENIDDIKCPRDIINPGLWYGFMKGYDSRDKEVYQLKSNKLGLLSQVMDADDKILELENKISLLEDRISDIMYPYE